MSQEKAQLIAPLGVLAVDGVTATGVITASSFIGNVVGSAKSLVNGANVSVGVITATSFDGNLTGNIQRLADSAPNINVGVTTASSFVGNLTGSVTDLTSQPAITVGLVTATSLSGPITGDVTGNITGNVTGVATGTQSGGNVVGDITGNVTGTISGNVTGNVTGNATGIADGLAQGGLGINYNGGWTGAGTSQLTVGVITATSFHGDGSNLDGVSSGPVSQQSIGTTYEIDVTASGSSNYTLSGTDRNGAVSGSDPTVTVEVGDTLNFVVDASGHPFYIRVSDGGANVSTPAATNQGSQSGTVSWTPNTAGTYYYQCGNHAAMLGTITVSATTTIDLSEGNLIYFNQTDDTTVSFANTANGNVYIVRTKDDNTTARTITWPTGIGWSGGSAPTLLTNPRATDAQVFLLTTRNMGLTWYGKEVVRSDPQTFQLWTAGRNMGSVSANSVPSNPAVSISSPTQVGGSSALWGMIGDSMDGYNYVATKADGTLWSWGYNQSGSLGLNENAQKYSSPVQVGSDTNWDAVRTTYGCVMATKTDGTIWVWGANTEGQLGLNDVAARSSPIQFAAANIWTWTTMGTRNGVGTKSDGTLWTWGDGDNGQIGNGSSADRSSPVQIPGTTWDTSAGGCKMGADIVVAKKTDGNLWAWGKNQSRGLLGISETSTNYFSSPKQVPGTWTDCVIGQCRSGFNGIIVAKSTGEIYMSGTNSEGQYGNNNRSTGSPGGMVEICNGKQFDPKNTKGMANFALSSDYKILAADSNGQIWIWGGVAYGEAGNNTNSDDGGPMAYSSPTQIPGKTGFDQFMWAGGSWVGRKQG